MLVKQWLREFLAGGYTSGRARLRVRNFRLPGIQQWKVYEIAAALPLLLQIALGLFLTGFCYFASAIHPTLRDTSIPLVGTWALFIFVTSIAPAFSSRCPYKQVVLKGLMKSFRVGQRKVFRYLARLTSGFSLAGAAEAVHESYVKLSLDVGWWWFCARLWWSESDVRRWLRIPWRRMAHGFRVMQWLRMARWPTLALPGILLRLRGLQMGLSLEENQAVKRADEDLQILASVDAIQSDDQLLTTVIWESVKQLRSERLEAATITFLLNVVAHRTHMSDAAELRRILPLNLTTLPEDVCLMVADVALNTMESACTDGPPAAELPKRDDGRLENHWIIDAILLFVSITSIPAQGPLQRDQWPNHWSAIQKCIKRAPRRTGYAFGMARPHDLRPTALSITDSTPAGTDDIDNQFEVRTLKDILHGWPLHIILQDVEPSVALKFLVSLLTQRQYMWRSDTTITKHTAREMPASPGAEISSFSFESEESMLLATLTPLLKRYLNNVCHTPEGLSEADKAMCFYAVQIILFRANAEGGSYDAHRADVAEILDLLFFRVNGAMAHFLEFLLTKSVHFGSHDGNAETLGPVILNWLQQSTGWNEGAYPYRLMSKRNADGIFAKILGRHLEATSKV